MKTHETSIAVLLPWGQSLGSLTLKNEDLRTAQNLKKLFERIEDTLHAVTPEKDRRFEVMLQLLLAKIYDEHVHPKPTQQMFIQDFTDAPLSDQDVKKAFQDVLEKAVTYYNKYLPRPVPATPKVPGSLLRNLSALLAPVRILGSKRDIVQEFYMYFAKEVYKWDLAQYFTPSEVVDFIVTLVNPQAGDQVKDPACGSGDFLVSAMHHAEESGASISDAVWGADNSSKAAQVSVLNMVLNGDGKSNITEEDSLENIKKEEMNYTVMLCNPPFGQSIVENRFEVLRNFQMGQEWIESDEGLQPNGVILGSQEVGILFAELCVRQAQPGGRVGIILPNGYLGNRTLRYAVLREWLLRNCRLVAIVAFPRFTFKKSGADVSASVVVLERRKKPLARAIDSENYPFYVGIIESVGWRVGDKRADRVYTHDPLSGDVMLDTHNEPILDADFNRVLTDLATSDVVNLYPWMPRYGQKPPATNKGWSISIKEVLKSPTLTIDPKRWCKRAVMTRAAVEKISHFTLGDVIDVVPPEGVPSDKSALYDYVEISNVTDGIVSSHRMRGWELPDRAKHRAKKGDIFIGSIWGSVGKWFVAGGDCSTTIVSNGFHRLRLKPGKENFLIDLVCGLNSEMYRIQARSLATGSDGLAEVAESDLLTVKLPKVTDKKARKAVGDILEAMVAGRISAAMTVAKLESEGRLPSTDIPSRSSVFVQV
jgi:type I restriction enzyme M protein